MESTNEIPYPKALVIDETYYILKEDYTYEWKMKVMKDDDRKVGEVNNRILVKKGFRWDGASVPKAFWRLGFKPDGPHRAAALIHDYIYIWKGKLPDGSMMASYTGAEYHAQHGSFSRRDCDRLFGRMLKQCGVTALRRKLMQWAVTWFGWIYWKDGPDVIRGTVLRTVLIGLFLWLVIKWGF